MTIKLAMLPAAASMFAAVSLSGCMTAGPDPQDPYEDFNRQMFSFNEGLDKAVIEPVAYGYRAVTNEPVREGVGNFTNNLGEPLTFVNHVLQGKLPDAGATFGRFVLNTTIGIAGVFDPASSLGIARTQEDFGQTLGAWGVQSGPFLVLPLFGPTNGRDLVGKGGDIALNPLNYPEFENDDSIRLGLAALGGINAREGAIETVDELRNQIDPYTTVRRLYGRTRAADIGIPYTEPNGAQEVPDDELDF
jgi:phospholipid-binding lipoprotein MlaA